jgi:hypothetical protein
MNVPDKPTIDALQRGYAAAVYSRGLSPDVAEKFEKLKQLQAQGASVAEITALAAELVPQLHFRIDDVNWERDWDPATQELRHNGLIVRIPRGA